MPITTAASAFLLCLSLSTITVLQTQQYLMFLEAGLELDIHQPCQVFMHFTF